MERQPFLVSMKKSTVYLLLAVIFFAALATYFALQKADVSRESRDSQATVSKLRENNRRVYVQEEQIRSLEKVNQEALEDGKNLLEENDGLKNSLLVKDNDLAKMKLFLEETTKARKQAEQESSRSAKALEQEMKRSRLLEKELEDSKNRYDALNGELVHSRQLVKNIELTLAARERELENLKDDFFAIEAELKLARERIKELED